MGHLETTETSQGDKGGDKTPEQRFETTERQQGRAATDKWHDQLVDEWQNLPAANRNDAGQRSQQQGVLEFGSEADLYGSKTLIAQAKSGEQHGLGSDGRWHFQNPRVKPGQDIAGETKEWLWNDAAQDCQRRFRCA